MVGMMHPTPDAVNDRRSLPGEITDCHFHVFQAGFAATPSARYVPGYAATLDAWRDAASRHGVGRGVLVQPSFLGHDNTTLLDTLARAPESLRGVAVVAPDTGLEALRAMGRAGVRALRLNLVGTDHDLSPWVRAGAFERLDALGWHVEVHVDAGRLPAVLRQLPSSLPVVADHFGKVTTAGEVEQACRFAAGRLHVTLSAAYRLSAAASPPTLARAWLEGLGPERLLWATDWPCTAHEAQRDAAMDPGAIGNGLGLPQLAAQVLVANPARLYGFEDHASVPTPATLRPHSTA